MAQIRNRQIVACATLAVGMLFSWYLMGYLALWYGMGRGVVNQRTYRMLEEAVYAPVECYIDDRCPGRDTVNQRRSWAWFKGGRDAGMRVPKHADGTPESFAILATAPSRLWDSDLTRPSQSGTLLRRHVRCCAVGGAYWVFMARDFEGQ